MTPDLSIVIATCNRAELLRKAIEAVRVGTSCETEVIVVDGASTDETPTVLAEMKERMGKGLWVIREEKREGFVKAVNKGFRLATGRNLIWINDDARPLAGALDLALEQVDAGTKKLGMAALFHRCDATRSIAYQTFHQGATYKLMHVRGTLYANFGMGRRETFERLGYFDERYFLNAADPDFALKVWHAGLQVVPAWGALVDHDEHEDPRRMADLSRAREDNAKLFAKWDLPERNPAFNDFQAGRPCTVRGLR